MQYVSSYLNSAKQVITRAQDALTGVTPNQRRALEGFFTQFNDIPDYQFELFGDVLEFMGMDDLTVEQENEVAVKIMNKYSDRLYDLITDDYTIFAPKPPQMRLIRVVEKLFTRILQRYKEEVKDKLISNNKEKYSDVLNDDDDDDQEVIDVNLDELDETLDSIANINLEEQLEESKFVKL